MYVQMIWLKMGGLLFLVYRPIGVTRKIKMKKLLQVSILVLVFLGVSTSIAATPEGIQGNVTVQNGPGNPVPVTIQSTGPAAALEVFTALPVFYRLESTVFGDDQSPDSDARVAVTERIILYDVTAQTTTIRAYTGCTVSIYTRDSAMTGPLSKLFKTTHFEKDVLISRDGQITQQRLGRGVVIEPGNDILIKGGGVTNPDIPVAGPQAFCSTTVQLYGEVLTD
jgi:hypothetical protein